MSAPMMPAMSIGALIVVFVVPVVIAAGFVLAVAVSRWALASVARGQAQDERAAAFGELPEAEVRAVMATRAEIRGRRALVIVGGKDCDGETK
jgi:hypothetical protein